MEEKKNRQKNEPENEQKNEQKNENGKKEKKGLRAYVWVMPFAAIALAAVILVAGGTGDKKASAARSETWDGMEISRDLVQTEAYCALVQTYRFIPCGHQVTRRVMLPDDLIGENFDTVSERYENWRVDTFSSGQVTMSRDENIYCPMHVVLMPDEAGNVAVFKNVYGDGMAYEEGTEYRMADFSGETQLKLFEGIGFDTVEDALNWLLAEVDNV